ncbi:polyprenyl synthetase family protein [Streptomyces albipurpureus]
MGSRLRDPLPGTPPAAGPGAESGLAAAVEKVLRQHLRDRVDQAARIDSVFAEEVAGRLADFVLRGGKRLRAGFVWWGWRVGGGTADGPQADAALQLGAALELLQGCALIHDDVMDESPIRRGAPAVHAGFAELHAHARMRGSSASFGTAAAVLCGDLALSWADDLMTVTALSCVQGMRVHQEWQAMRTELVAGQYLDMHAQANRSSEVAQAVRIAGLKSALYTVERPLALGAALAGADEATTSALRSAGRCAGIAFQLRDDLLGVFGDPAITGKPSGDDLRDGKPTYLRAAAVQLAKSTGDHHAVRALTREPRPTPLSDTELAALRDAIERTGARAAVEDKIGRLVELGIRHLNSVRCEPHIVPALTRLIERAAGTPAAETAGDAPQPEAKAPHAAPRPSGVEEPALAHARTPSGTEGPVRTTDQSAPPTPGHRATPPIGGRE